jgi:hypothetical protein
MRKLQRYLEHGCLETDSNAAERAMKPIALGWKNYLFVGSTGGGKAAAIAYAMVESAKLNSVDPQAWPMCSAASPTTRSPGPTSWYPGITPQRQRNG